MLTTTHLRWNMRANKIYVCTKFSSNGRSLEGYWVDYDSSSPNSNYALYLMEHTLNHSEMVEYYIVYDKDCNIVQDFDKEHRPKRK